MRYQTKNKRVLGIDPGIANTGWAVVLKSPGGYLLVSEGLIQTDSKTSTGERLLKLYQSLSEVVATHSPSLISIERCFHNKNISASQSTGAVIGIVHLIAAQLGCCPVQEFTPQQVKAASGLGGRADKTQVQRMTGKIFQREQMNTHIADAVVCALAGLLER